MFSEKFSELNDAYSDKRSEEKKLRGWFESEIYKIKTEKEKIRQEMAQEFIDKFSGSKDDIEYLLSERCLLSLELQDFSRKILKEKGFSFLTQNNRSDQKKLAIDLSNAICYKKAAENIELLFSIVNPIETYVQGEILKLIELSTSGGDWSQSKIKGSIFITKNTDNNGNYKVLLIGDGWGTIGICSGDDFVDLIENEVIPMLNEKYRYAE